MAQTECPYCEKEIDINEDDGFGLNPSETYPYECDFCTKNFIFTTDFTVNHYPQKAECLNGGEHDWMETVTIPRAYTKMRCQVCDNRRTPTDEEMAQILAG